MRTFLKIEVKYQKVVRNGLADIIGIELFILCQFNFAPVTSNLMFKHFSMSFLVIILKSCPYITRINARVSDSNQVK